MQRKKLSIHIETENIYYDNIDTGASIYSFFITQQDHTKKLMSEEFQFLDSYEGYELSVTNWKWKRWCAWDAFHNNIKFLFYQFNQYLVQLGKSLKLIRHTVIAQQLCPNCHTIKQVAVFYLMFAGKKSSNNRRWADIFSWQCTPEKCSINW